MLKIEKQVLRNLNIMEPENSSVGQSSLVSMVVLRMDYE